MSAPQLIRVRPRNQITIPRAASDQVRIHPGDVLELAVEAGRIILKPARLESEGFSADEWSRLERLVRSQVRGRRFREYRSAQDASNHLRRLRS